MYIIIGIIGNLSQSMIIFKVVPIVITILTLPTILYIFNAKIFWVIYLLLVKL